MSEVPNFSEPDKAETRSRLSLDRLISNCAKNIGSYLKEPKTRDRALQLAAAITVLSSTGCGREADDNLVEPIAKAEINRVHAQETNEPEIQSDQENTSTVDSLKSETGVSKNDVIDSIRKESGFEGKIVIKQINYLEDEDYLGVSIGVEGDPSKQELWQSGAFAIFKINEDNSVNLLYLLDKVGDDGQLILPSKPADISEEQWERIVEINYKKEVEINKI